MGEQEKDLTESLSHRLPSSDAWLNDEYDWALDKLEELEELERPMSEDEIDEIYALKTRLAEVEASESHLAKWCLALIEMNDCLKAQRMTSSAELWW